MRRTLALALVAAAALAAGGCSTSPCQRLGEKLCACTGFTSDVCTAQVENELKSVDQTVDVLNACQKFLDACTEPAGAVFCEWLQTADAKVACGLGLEPSNATTTP